MKQPVRRQGGSPPSGELARQKKPLSQQMAEDIGTMMEDPKTEDEEFLRKRPTPESRRPSRSRKALEAYVQAANPRAEFEERPLPEGKMGFVRTVDPDTLVISTHQRPVQREETILHEMEHSLSERGGNPLGVVGKFSGEPVTMDNNYRFDLLYNLQDKKNKVPENPRVGDLFALKDSGEGWKKRLNMVQNFIENKKQIEKFFGRPIESAYFSSRVFMQLAANDNSGALFAEQIADLSALEQITGKSLTRDPQMRKLLFPDSKAAAVFDAITGYRQTRLDSKDLPPYTPVFPEEPGILDWIKGKLGIQKREEGSPKEGEVSEGEIARRTLDFLRKQESSKFEGLSKQPRLDLPKVTKDVVRGVQYTPFDVLGAPVDIATMAMRPFGYNVEKPVGGSDYLIEQAAKVGLAQPQTGSVAEFAGRVLGGGLTPVVASKTGKIGEATEDFIKAELAKPPEGVIKVKGGNVLFDKTSLNTLRPMVAIPGEKGLPPSQFFASEIAATLKDQIARNKQAGSPTTYIEEQLSAIEPKAALDSWIQTKLSKYIRSDMGSEADPVRKLAEEMSTKVRANYDAGLKRIAKMKDDIAKAKAVGRNTDASEAELAAEIDKVENAFRQTSMLPVQLGPYTHPAKQTGLNREKAGFPSSPISKTSLAKEWEEVADRQFYVHRAGDFAEESSSATAMYPRALQENPWVANLNPEEIVYTVPRADEMHMITHTLDELENALNPASGLPQRLQLKPEDMQQLGIEKAFRLVNDINDWRLQQRIALNLEEAKRAAVTVKQYSDSPGGLQWQELKAPTYTELPPGYTIEQLDYNTATLRGPDGKALTYFGDIVTGNVDAQKEALSFLAKNDLERALKYEGSTMRHCVGGYCDDVWSGQTRIYSLRDSKGEPHVTIETAPVNRSLNDSIETFLQENPGNITERLGFDAEDFLYARRNASPFNPETETELNRFLTTAQNSPEFNQWLQANPPGESILQIKGKANQKPTEKYIPFVQDFVSSQRWYSIGDRENADLVPLQPTLLKNAQDRGFTPNVVATAGDQPYITKEEFNRLAELFGGMNKYAAGGEVTKFIMAHA